MRHHYAVIIALAGWMLAFCAGPADPVLKPADLKGYPAGVQGKTDLNELPADRLLRTIAADTWRFFEHSVVRENGLIVDHLWVEPARIGTGTSVTNIGLHILAVISAVDLDLLTVEDAVNDLGRILATVERLPTYRGHVYNWYNLVTLEALEPFVSTVDLAWYCAALTILGHTFPAEFGTRCEALVDQIDFSRLYDDSRGHFYHGYNVREGKFSPYHYSLLYSEARIASYLAMARGDIPADHWYRLQRTLPAAFEQQQVPEGDWFLVDSIRYFKGHYSYNGLQIIPSWGGSLFEYLAPAVFVDERRLAPRGAGANLERAVAIHRVYALDRLGYPVWGLAPSTTPGGGYGEFGVPDIGIKVDGYPPGVITPYASILALAYDPEAVIDNLKRLLKLYPIYGEYGFYDCVNPITGEVGRAYLALDQGLILLSLNNFLNDGVMAQRFQALPGMQKVLAVIAAEQAF